MPEFNERLAALYNGAYSQLIGLDDYWWAHMPGGDWYLRGKLF